MSFSYDSSIPAADHNPSIDQQVMQTNALAIENIWAVDHYTFETGTDGKHKQVTFTGATSPVPTNPQTGTAGVLYATLDSGSACQLSFVNKNGIIPLTTGNPSVAANGYTYLPGGLLFQWGTVNATPAGATFTFPKAFSSAVYSVTLGMRATGAQSCATALTGTPLSTITVYSQTGTQVVYVMAIGV